MSALTIVSNRNDDNSITVSVTIPPRHNDEPNFGCLGRINHVLLPVNPDAFDPRPVAIEIAHRDGHTADGAGLVEAMLDRAAEEPDGLKNGEAYRGAA